MPHRFCNGKKGSGKSWGFADEIMRELRDETRNRFVLVSENLGLNLPELEKIMHDEGMRGSIESRLTILDSDQCATFWRFRGDHIWTPRCRPAGSVQDYREYDAKEHGKSALVWEVYSPPAGHPGCVYFIDECHTWFDQYAYDRVRGEMSIYMKQERKLKDDIWFASPSLDDVAKPLRLGAEEYRVYRNLRRTKISRFRMPSAFQYFVYSSPSNRPGVQLDYDVFKRMNIDRVGKVYSTASGSGIKGTTADIGSSAKGLPWWVPIGGVVALGCLCAGVMIYLVKHGGGFVYENINAPLTKKVDVLPPTIAQPVPVPPASPAAPPSRPAPAIYSAPPVVEMEREKVSIVGVSEGAAGVTFYLSDGREIPNPKGALWEDGCLHYNGRRYCR